jgi:hypothetical protein
MFKYCVQSVMYSHEYIYPGMLYIRVFDAVLAKFQPEIKSVGLAQARKRRKFLSQVLSSLRTGLVLRESIVNSMQELDDPITLPITRRECSQQLRRITREIQQLVAESYARRDTERVRKLQVLDQSTRPIDRKKAIDLRNIKKAEDIKEVLYKSRRLTLTNG